MSIASEIARLQTAKANLKTAIEGKGVTVQSSATLSDYADLVDSIETGHDPDQPNGFTRLNALESVGSQVIDTGQYGKLNSKLVIDAMYIPGAQGAYTFIAGSANPPIVPMCIQESQYPTATGTVYSSFGNAQDKIPSPSSLPFIRGTITLDKNTCTVIYSGLESTKSVATLNASSITENQNSHICLFARGNNGSYERFSKCRIYEYWYYENDVLVQHMIPVKRNSDDALGFYDLVNDVFYQNVGTGSFTGIEM